MDFSVGRMFLVNSKVWLRFSKKLIHVITSYSIHYTKLYEGHVFFAQHLLCSVLAEDSGSAARAATENDTKVAKAAIASNFFMFVIFDFYQ